MKKQLFFVALVATVVLFASCRKDDLDPRKPFRVQGEVSPGYGVPLISEGSLNLGALLTSFGGSFAEYIDMDQDIITLYFADTISNTINLNKSQSKGNSFSRRFPKTKTNPDSLIYLVDTNISYEIPINAFDQMQDINVQIAHMWMHLKVDIHGDGVDDDTRTFLRNNASISLNRLNVKYQPGGSTSLVDFDGNSALNDSLVFSDIVTGDSMEFTNVNLASIVNSRPEKIVASFHMNFNVSTHVYDSIVADILADPLNADTAQLHQFQTMLEKMQMSHLTYTAALDVVFPFELQGSITYEYPMNISSINLKEQLDNVKEQIRKYGGDLVLDSLNRLIFEFENGIPFDFNLNAALKDANGTVLDSLFTNGLIASAQTTPIAGNPGVSEATAATHSNIIVVLNENLINALSMAKTANLNIGLATAGTDKKAIKQSDELKIKMKLQLHPRIPFDRPLLGSN